MSSKIAARERSFRFYISPARLTQIETGNAVPSQFKIFTLSVIYGISFHKILNLYGVDPDRVHSHRAQLKLSATRTVSVELSNPDTRIAIPARLDPSFKWERTQLLSRAVALWGEIPAAFLLEWNPRRHIYAYVGLEDHTMSPLLKPGSLVMVDGERRQVEAGPWAHEYERPMYLVELRDGYICSWCQRSGSCLTIVPHSLSGAPVRSFNLATEAELVGQVVGVAMRLVPTLATSRAHGTAPPGQS